MKKLIFALILMSSISVVAAPPSIERVAQAYFQFMGISATGVEVNLLEERPFSSEINQEIFFRANGIYFNCTVEMPSVRLNPVFAAYDVRGFSIGDCQNYETGASVDYIASFKLAARADRFESGVAFYNNNRQFELTSEFYSVERIGQAPNRRP